MANDEKVKLSQTLSCNIGAYNFIWCWVEIVNRNTMNMTVRQKVLKAIYPIFSMYNRVLGNKSRIISNKENFTPPVSIYDLSFKLNDGNPFSMKNAKGKKLLIVNTASDCGYTGQYVELQKLYQEYKDKLLVIGFPANDFKDQEMRSDEEIEQFCTYNYGVTFPLAAKSTVVKSPGQNEIYKWLTHKSHNGWNENQPSWNFAKFLINEKGVLTNYFDPSISPVSDQVLEKLKN